MIIVIKVICLIDSLLFLITGSFVNENFPSGQVC